jgi:hypothetical protein
MVEYPLILALILSAFVVFGAVTAYVSRVAARRTDLHPAE